MTGLIREMFTYRDNERLEERMREGGGKTAETKPDPPLSCCDNHLTEAGLAIFTCSRGHFH